MERLLYAPLLTILVGVLVAAAAGLPGLNRRLTVTNLAWLLALAPLVAFGFLLGALTVLGNGAALVWHFDWVPSLGLGLGLYFDHLSALFALLVTGIGTVVVVYASYYLKSEQRLWGQWSGPRWGWARAWC
jgi:NADH:ubiquinone oxidoreductase subunit 5 (subunit L)/multisubunit Na+/H+ antiporter MnhA subunit